MIDYLLYFGLSTAPAWLPWLIVRVVEYKKSERRTSHHN